MSFSRLYAAVQGQTGRISSKWLKDRAIELCEITSVKQMWSSVIDSSSIRGFYVEGPMGPPVPLAENEALIVLSRAMCVAPGGDAWRRFVYTKELMHVFDTSAEKANSHATFDLQIEKFADPSADTSPQFRAEQKALWRALAVLCPEAQRLEYKRQIAQGEISLEVLSAALHLPPVYVRELLRDQFEGIVQHLLAP